MSNIIHISGEVQLNTPYNTNKQLKDCGLTDWRIATNDEVNTWKQETNYESDRIATRKTQIVQDYKDIFNSIDLLYCRKIVLGQSTKTDYITARTNLQTELVTKLNEV